MLFYFAVVLFGYVVFFVVTVLHRSFVVNFVSVMTKEWLGSRVVSMRRRAWVQIAVATLSGNSFRQTVHTHRASVHQAAKFVAALLRVAGLAESNGSLPSGL